MPKNIVVCCDGTGCEYGDRNSNVVQLYQALLQNDRRQLCYYHPGVGTEGSPTARNRVEAFYDVVTGLGVGPHQSIKQVWFAGTHSDVGGSYPSAQAGLSQITLQWMLCEAVQLGLLVDSHHAAEVLGRIPPPPPLAPNPAQPIHDSLKGLWWLLEVLPHRYYNWATRKKYWTIPLGTRRVIPPGSIVHQSVVDKIQIDPTYRPKNLPSDWKGCIEPDNPCRFY